MAFEVHELVEHLSDRRKTAHVSINEAARRMGVSTMTVRRIERGEVSPPLDVLERYASAVGVDLAWETSTLEEVVEDLPVRGRPVDVAWGLDDPMPGRVVGVHGSPVRPWVQVELDEGPIIDVPLGAVTVRRVPRKRARP